MNNQGFSFLLNNANSLLLQLIISITIILVLRAVCRLFRKTFIARLIKKFKYSAIIIVMLLEGAMEEYAFYFMS